MNLPDLLLADHSGTQTDRIIAWVGQSQARFDELFTLFSGEDQLLAQRAAWPLSYLVSDSPELIKKHWKKLVENGKKNDRHPAIRRNTLRLMQKISIPGKYKGEVMTFCYRDRNETTPPIAISYYDSANTSLNSFGDTSGLFNSLSNSLKIKRRF